MFAFFKFGLFRDVLGLRFRILPLVRTRVVVHNHSWKCEFAMSNFRHFGTIMKNANINTSRALGGFQ